MRNQPDDLTECVLQLLAAARTSPLTRDDVMEQLTLALRRNLSYVARKERSGQHTPYVAALEGDLEAIARAMVLLQEADSGQGGGSP